MADYNPLTGSASIKKSDKSWWDRTFSHMGPGSVRGSIFNMCIGTMGSGMLGFPYAIKACGLATGAFLLLFCGVAFTLYYIFIVMACQQYNSFTFVGVMEAAYGSWGKKVTELSIFIILFGAIASLEVLVSNFSLHVLYEVGVVGDPEAFLTRLICLLLLNALVFFPMGIQKDLHTLQYVSLLGILCYIYLNLLVVVMSPWYIDNYLKAEDIVYSRWDLAALDASAILFYGYSGSTAVPVIYKELNDRSVRRGVKVFFRSMLFMIFFYTAIGILGYLSFPADVPELIVYRPSLYPGTYDYPMLVARLLLIIAFSAQLPTILNPLRLTVEQIKGGSDFQRNNVFYVIVTIVLLVIPLLIALFVPSVLDYFKFLGGLFSVITNIILPTLLYLKCTDSYLARLGTLVMSLFLTALGFACVGNMIYMSVA